MDTQTIHTLAIGAIVLCQLVTGWAVVNTRAKLTALQASIPPDVTGDITKLNEKVDDAHKRLTGVSTSLKHTGEALRTAAARLGAN